jgi:hypothetical protein
MNTLINLLTDATTDLKAQFIENTEKWAINQFDWYLKVSSFKDIDWCKYLQLTPRIVNEGLSNEFRTFPKGFFNTKESVTYFNAKNKAEGIVRGGKDKFIKDAINAAESHYSNSIAKLADRIETKGLNLDNLSLSSTRLEHNFETIISDGVKNVRAWTILASGYIQKPHYRYLVK